MKSEPPADVFGDVNRWALRDLERDYHQKKSVLLNLIRDAEYAVFDPVIGETVRCKTSVPAEGWHVDWAGLSENVQKELVIGDLYEIEEVYPTRAIRVKGIMREFHVTYFERTAP